jgi:hypothetical protein
VICDELMKRARTAQSIQLKFLTYLRFYESLAAGRRPPATDAQRHFVEVCHMKAKALFRAVTRRQR